MHTTHPDRDSSSIGGNKHVPKTDYASLLQTIGGHIAVLLLLGIGGFALMGGLGASAMGDAPLQSEEMFLLFAVGNFFAAGVLWLSARSALDRLSRGKTYLEMFPPAWMVWVIVPFPLVVYLLAIVPTTPVWGKVTLGILHLLAALLPVLWFVALGRRNLPVFTRQRNWGLLSAGLFLSPFFALIGEVFALGGVVALVIAYVSNRPALALELERVMRRVMYGAYSPELVEDIIKPYISQPLFIGSALLLVGLLVPLIEELVKPLGVWLLARRKLTPAGGFVAGLLCGAGFALFENLTISANAGGDLWAVALTRSGTSLVHIFTAGLMGWALASAWRHGKYGRVGVAYFIAVAVHATWNVGVLLVVFVDFSAANASVLHWITPLSRVAPYVMTFLLLVLFAGLLFLNNRLRRAIIAPASSPEGVSTLE